MADFAIAKSKSREWVAWGKGRDNPNLPAE